MVINNLPSKIISKCVHIHNCYNAFNLRAGWRLAIGLKYLPGALFSTVKIHAMSNMQMSTCIRRYILLH
jgi:hypothetical protein